jgi:hypothetical protein
MKHRSKWLPALLVLCLVAAGYIVFARVHKPAKLAMQGFTQIMTQTAYPANGAPILTATKVRQQKSDGSWRLETTYSSGKVDIGYSQPGRGVFNVDHKDQKLDYLSQSSGRPLADIDWTKKPGYVGEETILGYKTYHIHTEGNGQYSDNYFCPALQGFPLRMISGNDRGKTVFETTQILLGEPVFPAPPNYPEDKTRYNLHNQ